MPPTPPASLIPPRSLKVLVTGFGPWGPNTSNPSEHIVALLPTSLPTHPEVEIITHSPLPVSWKKVANILPFLLEEHQPDIILHIGLASGRSYYAIERSSQRGRYSYPDADGLTLTKEENDEILPDDTPQRIETGLVYDEVCEDWKKRCGGNAGCKGVVVRDSDEVGLYLCGFSYYTSLAWNMRNRGNCGSVLFLHVPECPTKADLERGKNIAVQLLGSMIDGHESMRSSGI